MKANPSDPSMAQNEVNLPSDWRYEDTIREVETIINDIETGQLDLADVFERFTTAITYLRQCEMFLADRQGQMELLIEELGDETDF
ncbi:exodeoxyribonuclease VII small subunit [Acaryochloris sp. IP29b_bin.137]|uniref:exodeoxyribonuclease VII small subunit n=1 Tax=Acaryochloris sp. IP29b_bin.137 TaxID=2969217 RepID=UPI00261DF525|nr:exodeoxyribonuclease VII small subunit [Acaryochloris sp. IP29b_bin.137]